MLQETSTSFLYGMEYNFEGGKQLIPGFDTTQNTQDNAKQIMTYSSTIDPCTTGLLGKRRQEGWNTLKKDFFVFWALWYDMSCWWVGCWWCLTVCFETMSVFFGLSTDVSVPNLLIFSLLSLCQSFLMMVVPRWHAYMLNPKTCGNFVESWIARLKQTGQDQLMLGAVLQFLERLYVAGLACKAENVHHRHLWLDAPDFIIKRLEASGHLA